MGKLIFRLAFLLLTPLVIAVSIFLYLRSNLLIPIDASDSKPIVVEIPEQTDLSGLTELLLKNNLIKASWALTALHRINPDSTKVIFGEYELRRNMTPREILEKLRSGDVVKRRVTIKDGFTIWDVANAFEEAGIRDRASVLTALVSNELLTRAGISNTSFEGYLYPGDYQFSKTEGLPKIIWKMMETGENAWGPEFADRADELKLSRHEVLILASLIQAETDNSDLQIAISGVFHNRLMNLMRLESIPALRYGSKTPQAEPSEGDYGNAENLYNTFVHYGLPPGPICTPGAAAISAALNFQNHQFLFFLKDGSGGFLFAETLNEYAELKQKLSSK